MRSHRFFFVIAAGRMAAACGDDDGLPALTVTTISLPGGTEGVPYSATLEASDGIRPYTWSLASGDLPAGLALDEAGIVSGTPTTSGSSSFTVQVTDESLPQQTAFQGLGISVN